MISAFEVSNVRWKADPDMFYELPTRLLITVSYPKKHEGEVENVVMDYLSSEYGWDVESFDMEQIVEDDEDDTFVVDCSELEDY